MVPHSFCIKLLSLEDRSLYLPVLPSVFSLLNQRARPQGIAPDLLPQKVFSTLEMPSFRPDSSRIYSESDSSSWNAWHMTHPPCPLHHSYVLLSLYLVIPVSWVYYLRTLSWLCHDPCFSRWLNMRTKFLENIGCLFISASPAPSSFSPHSR